MPTAAPITFRRADRSDSAVVARLLQSVWPDQLPADEVLTATLAAADVVTRLAFITDLPIGLTSCFVTLAADLQPRWELDLLLIDPAHQGRGFSAALLQDALSLRPPDCRLTRALVADGLAARTRMYRRAGFLPDEPPLQLWIRSLQSAQAGRVDVPARLINVTTLLYHGAWLEDVSSPQHLAAAAAIQDQRSLATLGTLLPADGDYLAAAAARLGYAAVGRYRRWTVFHP